jgi:hypothetical protein
MKRPTKTERLLDDVLAETASAEFRQAVLQQALLQARRRRHVRMARRVLVTVAVLAAAAFWLRPRQRPAGSSPIVKGLQPESTVTFVETQPLPPVMLVETKPGLVAMVSSSSSVTFVATRPADELFQQLNDDQLLALVAGQPIALVRRSPHEAALIMPDEIQREGFRVQ